LEGSSTLLPLKSLSKKIDTLRGEAGFVFGLTGKWDNPKINGGVTVSNAIFGVRDIPSKISSINGYLYMDGDKIVIEKLSGKTGGGDLELSGVAYLKGFTLKRFYLDAALSNIGMNVSKEFPVNFSGNLLYTGTLLSQTLSGDIRINHAFYREPLEWKSWLLKGKAQDRPRGEIGAFEKIGLNIKVLGSDNVVINNNVARAALVLDLVLRGTVANPLIFGRAETKTGIVYFRNNEFKILRATADFADPKRINPILNITAETSISNYDIRMNLGGQIEHFDMTLSSTPSLEETEILSLLTTGTLGKESKGIEGGINLSAATSFLSGQLQDIAQERVKSITGIDRIGVESYTSRVTGKSEQRFMVSKRLIGDDLSVTYATSFNAVETSVIRIEYNLGGNVTLIGLKDESGGLGGNIKFRFSFK
jgi:translocation and assembly module TamB